MLRAHGNKKCGVGGRKVKTLLVQRPSFVSSADATQMAILVAYMSSVFIPTTQMYMYCMNMCLMCNLHIVSQFSHFQLRRMFIEGVLNPRLG